MNSFQESITLIYNQISKLTWELEKLKKDYNCSQCNTVTKCLGISKNGDPDKFLNEKGKFTEVDSFSCESLNNCNTDNLPEGSNLYFTNNRAISALTGENISIFNNDSGYITSSALTGYATETYVNSQGFITSSALAPYLTSANAALTYYPLTNPSGYTSNTGTVTSVGGTGTVSGLTLTGTVTTSGNLTLGGTLSLNSSDITTGLGFTPENVANKQNSLAVDGTGTKYPTIDAVNAALSNVSNPLIKVYSTQNFI